MHLHYFGRILRKTISALLQHLFTIRTMLQYFRVKARESAAVDCYFLVNGNKMIKPDLFRYTVHLWHYLIWISRMFLKFLDSAVINCFKWNLLVIELFSKLKRFIRQVFNVILLRNLYLVIKYHSNFLGFMVRTNNCRFQLFP